jgi:hypothetical protein
MYPLLNEKLNVMEVNRNVRLVIRKKNKLPETTHKTKCRTTIDSHGKLASGIFCLRRYYNSKTPDQKHST